MAWSDAVSMISECDECHCEHALGRRGTMGGCRVEWCLGCLTMAAKRGEVLRRYACAQTGLAETGQGDHVVTLAWSR